MSLWPHRRTFDCDAISVVLGQERTHAPQQTADYLAATSRGRRPPGRGMPVVGQFQLNEGKYQKAERVSTLIQSASFTRRSVRSYRQISERSCRYESKLQRSFI